MIAHVNGYVAEKFGNSVIVDVQGVGYEVQVAGGDYEGALLKEPIKFYTYHHVREQQEDLFGFSSLAAKRLFELLISVQGVGPKAALAILSIGQSEQVRSAIASSDVAYIQQASGIGKRSAERVIVELKDKVGLASATYGSGPTMAAVHQDDALDALISLGYSLAQASAALEKIDKSLSTEDRIKKALKEI